MAPSSGLISFAAVRFVCAYWLSRGALLCNSRPGHAADYCLWILIRLGVQRCVLARQTVSCILNATPGVFHPADDLTNLAHRFCSSKCINVILINERERKKRERERQRTLILASASHAQISARCAHPTNLNEQITDGLITRTQVVVFYPTIWRREGVSALLSSQWRNRDISSSNRFKIASCTCTTATVFPGKECMNLYFIPGGERAIKNIYA